MNNENEYFKNYDCIIWFCSTLERALAYLETAFKLQPQNWVTDSYRCIGTNKDNEKYDYIAEVRILSLTDSLQNKLSLVFKSFEENISDQSMFYVYSENEQLQNEVCKFLKTISLSLIYAGKANLANIAHSLETVLPELRWLSLVPKCQDGPMKMYSVLSYLSMINKFCSLTLCQNLI